MLHPLNITATFLPELSSCDSLRLLLPRRLWALGGSPSFPEAIAERCLGVSALPGMTRDSKRTRLRAARRDTGAWRPLAPLHSSQAGLRKPLRLSQVLRRATLPAFISASDLAPPFPAPLLPDSWPHQVPWLDFFPLFLPLLSNTFADSHMPEERSHPTPYPASPPPHPCWKRAQLSSDPLSKCHGLHRLLLSPDNSCICSGFTLG